MLNDKQIKKKIFFFSSDIGNQIDFFGSLKIPTLNVIGEKDIVIPFNYSLYFASFAKNGKTIVYKDTGHIIAWEVTKSFNRVIAKFSSKV